MIKDDRNYHQRLQEFCDCYMETDPKKELEKASKGISGDPSGNLDELALKFLGLGIFYGASEKAKKIFIQRSKDGKVTFSVDAKGKYQLPAPTTPVSRPGDLYCSCHHSYRYGSGEASRGHGLEKRPLGYHLPV